MTTILGNSTGCVPRSGEVGGVCSGRGVCVDVLVGSVVRPTCLCEAGWSPIGDLATDPSVDCGINVAAQRALWGIATISQVLLLGLSVTRLYQKRKKMKWSRVDTKVFTFGFIQGLCMSIICIMQAINSVPGATSIGIDPVTTSLFAIGCSAFMIMIGTHNHAVLNLAAAQARMTINDRHPIKKSIASSGKLFLIPYMTVALFGSFIPLAFLADNPQNDQVFGSCHYVACTLTIVFIMIYAELIAVPLRRQVQNLRREGSVDAGVEQAIAILNRSIQQLRVNGAIQTCINLLMAAVPILLRKASYQMPLAWLFISFGCIDIFRNLGLAMPSSGNSAGKSARTSKSKSSQQLRQVVGTAGESNIVSHVVSSTT